MIPFSDLLFVKGRNTYPEANPVNQIFVLNVMNDITMPPPTLYVAKVICYQRVILLYIPPHTLIWDLTVCTAAATSVYSDTC